MNPYQNHIVVVWLAYIIGQFVQIITQLGCLKMRAEHPIFICLVAGIVTSMLVGLTIGANRIESDYDKAERKKAKETNSPEPQTTRKRTYTDTQTKA